MVGRCSLFTGNLILWAGGAALLGLGLTAFFEPDVEPSLWLVEGSSVAGTSTVAVAFGCWLLAVGIAGCWAIFQYRYWPLTTYLVLVSLSAAAQVAYIALQLVSCIRERVCTKSLDLENKKHVSILAQAVFLFCSVATLALAILSRSGVHRGYRAVRV